MLSLIIFLNNISLTCSIFFYIKHPLHCLPRGHRHKKHKCYLSSQAYTQQLHHTLKTTQRGGEPQCSGRSQGNPQANISNPPSHSLLLLS